MVRTNSTITQLECHSCNEPYELDVAMTCSNCGGILDPKYDLDSIDIDRSDWENRSGSMWKYEELLPVRYEDSIVSLGEGDTPLVECTNLIEALDINRLLIKDEGQNPTNTFKDRGASAAISVASEYGFDAIGLPSAGNAGQAASAYAARAGISCDVFLNHIAGEVQKNWVNAHGAKLHLSDGKLPDAGSSYKNERDNSGWYSAATFETPYRHDGKKTMGLELFEQLEWSAPDHIVYPTGGGVGLIGIWKAYKELNELNWLDDNEPPSLHVAQSSGCAPVVEAINHGVDVHTPWENPDSIARGVEVPDPGASPWILESVYESGGTGIAVTDTDALDASRLMASRGGIEMCIEAGVALAGAIKLSEQDVFESDEDVVVINTGAGCKTSNLMGVSSEQS